jgi:hypothetical protein
MGGAVSAVSSAVSSVGNAVANTVTAPVNVVKDVVQGKNIAESIGSNATKVMAGANAGFNSLVHSTGADRVISKVPGVGSVVSTYVQSADEINNGGRVTRSQALNYYRSGGETLGLAAGGYAVGSGAISTSTAFTGVTAAKAVTSGNYVGALTAVGGDALGGMGPDLGPLTDAWNQSKDYWSLLDSAKPANLGPYPSSSFDFADSTANGLAPASTAFNPTLIVLGVGAVGAYFLLRRK